MLNASHTWGTTVEERRRPFPCDRFLHQPEAILYRGVTINAPPAVVFRWLCQMRVAPYSYDWLDNGGRQSPRTLTPGLENLAIGQDVMRIFTLVDFGTGDHLTLRLKPHTGASNTFGDIMVSYVVISESANKCRLVVKMLVNHPHGFRGWLNKTFLPWGDLIMMRKQMLNFKRLAEGKSD